MSKEAELSVAITTNLCDVIDRYALEYEMDNTFDPIIATAISELAIVYLNELKKKYPKEVYQATKIYFVNRIASNT